MILKKVKVLDLVKKWLKRHENKPLDGIEALLSAISKRTEDFVVAEIDESVAYSEKYSSLRADPFDTGTIYAVLEFGYHFYILAFPRKKMKKIIFMLYTGVRSDLSPEQLLDVSNFEAYLRDLEEIDARQRIDYRFYQKRYIELEEELSNYKTVDEISREVRCGQHTTFKRTRKGHKFNLLVDGLAPIEQLKAPFYSAFIGIENISSVGCVEGLINVYESDEKPKIRSARRGDLVMALVSSRGSKDDYIDKETEKEKEKSKEADDANKSFDVLDIGNIGKVAIVEADEEDDANKSFDVLDIGNIGKVAIVEADEEYFVNQSFTIITPDSGINAYFLWLSLTADYFKEQLNRYRKPVGKYQDNVTVSDLKKLRVILDDKATMDRKGGHLEAIIRNHKDYLRSINKLQKEIEPGKEKKIITDRYGNLPRVVDMSETIKPKKNYS